MITYIKPRHVQLKNSESCSLWNVSTPELDLECGMRNAQQRGSLRKLMPFVYHQIGGITMIIGTNFDII